MYGTNTNERPISSSAPAATESIFAETDDGAALLAIPEYNGRDTSRYRAGYSQFGLIGMFISVCALSYGAGYPINFLRILEDCKNTSNTIRPACTEVITVNEIDPVGFGGDNRCPKGSVFPQAEPLGNVKVLRDLFGACPSDGIQTGHRKYNEAINSALSWGCSRDLTPGAALFNTGFNTTEYRECMADLYSIPNVMLTIFMGLATVAAVYMLLKCISGLKSLSWYAKTREMTSLNVTFNFKSLGGDTYPIIMPRNQASFDSVISKVLAEMKSRDSSDYIVGKSRLIIDDDSGFTMIQKADMTMFNDKPIQNQQDFSELMHQNAASESVSLMILFAESRPTHSL
jgi:hypothetical protein